MSQHLNQLKVTLPIENCFIEFVSRKSLHKGKEYEILFDRLPSLFFADASCKFDKHVVKQWFGVNFLLISLHAIVEVSASFENWLLNDLVKKDFF